MQKLDAERLKLVVINPTRAEQADGKTRNCGIPFTIIIITRTAQLADQVNNTIHNGMWIAFLLVDRLLVWAIGKAGRACGRGLLLCTQAWSRTRN